MLDRDNGAFAARPAAFGQGDPGPIDFDDVRGLSFDLVNRTMYASDREVGSDDTLFLIALASGAHLPPQFSGGRADYVPISGGGCPSTVDDDANDPVSHSFEVRVFPGAGVAVNSTSTTMRLSAPRRARPGLQALVSASYRKISGTAAVTLVLPTGMSVVTTFPSGAVVNGSEVRWEGLPGPGGKVKVLLAAELPAAATRYRLPAHCNRAAARAPGR